VPWEMLSGPDLGGGFLFQLTVEPMGPRSRLVYHAQEGGIDASGPPKGSPLPLGFAPTESPCRIGGRDCYHRSFDLAPEQVARARLAYNRLRFVTAPMLAQRYEGAPVPVATALEEVAARLAPAFAARPDGWFLGGTVAASLQGAAVAPREIDLGTDREGAATIATALSEYLIEPLADTTWPGPGAIFGARAYVGTLVAGVRVQWGVVPNGSPVGASDLGVVPERVATRSVRLGERAVRVSRPEYALVRAALAHDRATESAVTALLRSDGPEPGLLDRLLDSSALPAKEQARIRLAVRPSAA
jgi:hypothetical protein